MLPAKVFIQLIFLLVLGALLPGCGPHHEPSLHDAFVVKDLEDAKELKERERKKSVEPISKDAYPRYQILEGIEVQTMPEYRIGAGDILEIVYHIEYTLDEGVYKLEVQDEINVLFPFHPQFSSTVVIRTDGSISLPLIGDIKVVGLTTEELNSVLRHKYKKYIHKPSVTVSLQNFNVKIDELKRAITTAPRGQSKTAPVAPDGRIALPIVGNMQAAGYSINELESIINKKYRSYVENLHTTLILNEINHMKFYVFGEVATPGVYEFTGRTNMLDVFALSEGFTADANLSEVTVYRSNGLKEPMVFVVDVEEFLTKGIYLSNLDIQPADVIYVPKGRLDHANDMIAKIFTDGLYSILPFQSSFGVGYQLNRP